MQQSARDGNQTRFRRIYGKAGQPCPRCGPGAPIRSRGMGEDNRTTYWCAGMSDVTVRRVGHKGADHIAPGNTTASFDAALAAARRHDRVRRAARRPRRPGARRSCSRTTPSTSRRTSLTLEQGLAHLAVAARSPHVELDVDLKLPGYEEHVLRALREHGLVERTIVSTLYMRSLVTLRALEPGLRLGWSVPRVKKDYTRSPVTAIPAYGLLLNARRRLPAVAAAHVRAGPDRRPDGALAHGHAAARSRAARRGRRPLRVDGRRRGADPPAGARWA